MLPCGVVLPAGAGGCSCTGAGIGDSALLPESMIARSEGTCAGGGLEFGWSTTPPGRFWRRLRGGTPRFALTVGTATVKELALVGAQFNAEESLRSGPVHRVLSDGAAFHAEVAGWTECLAAPPASARATVELSIARALDAPLRESIACDAQVVAGHALGRDLQQQQGVAASLEKRQQRFGGQA